MGLIERITNRKAGKVEKRYSVDDWLANYLIPVVEGFAYNGAQYMAGGLNTTYRQTKIEQVAATLPGYSAALKACPPAFAAELIRASVVSQARLTFRNLPSSPTARRTFGNKDLAILEKPWPNAATSDLLARMEWHAGLAGNAYVARFPTRLRVLRPDWVKILYGSKREPDEAGHAIDGELIGYVYKNGGWSNYNDNKPVTLTPEQVAHWAPLPDPEGVGLGMSWITPAIREIQGDRAATEHKLKFFENGATPNLVISGIKAAPGEQLTKEKFDEIVNMLEASHAGVRNAYRTLYLTEGADATIVGSDLQAMDFKGIQGRSETRIAMLSRVHPVILAAAEGLSGSSLNAGNFGMARRIFADSWVYPTLQGQCQALSSITRVPEDAELWFDVVDVPLLREDAKDAAEIVHDEVAAIGQAVRDGFEPASAMAAVKARDVSLLKHTGLVSVQLYPGDGSGNQNQPPQLPAPGNNPNAQKGDQKQPNISKKSSKQQGA